MRLEKHKNILDYGISYVLRRKGRNLATILVFTLIVFTIASVAMLTTSLEREAQVVLNFAPDITVQKIQAGRQVPMEKSYAEAIKNIKGITRVEERIWGYYYDAERDVTYTILGVSSDSPLYTDGCAIGSALARKEKINTGDNIILQNYKGEYVKFRVEKIFPAQSDIIAGDLIVLPREKAREFFGYSGNEVTDLAVYVANPIEIPNIARKIANNFPELRVLSKDSLKQTYSAIFGWRSGVFLIGLISSLLAFAILVWDRASGMSAEERREIGILKAIGWETKDILELKTYEALIVSLNSYLLGVLLAFIHVYLLNAPLLKPLLIGWSTLYPEFALKPAIGVGELTIIFFVTVLPYLASVIVPSWKASTISPEVAMRGL